MPRINLEHWRDTNTCIIGNQAVGVGDTRTPTPCTICTCTPSGGQCQTLKVNCFELRSRFGLDEILRDSLCRAQCGNILDPNRPPQQLPRPPSIPPAPAPAPTPTRQPRPVDVFNEGLTPPPPPPQIQQPPRPLPPRQRPPPPPRSPTGPIFRPFAPPPQNNPLPFPIPSFLRPFFS